MISDRIYFLTHTVGSLIEKGWNGDAALEVALRLINKIAPLLAAPQPEPYDTAGRLVEFLRGLEIADLRYVPKERFLEIANLCQKHLSER